MSRQRRITTSFSLALCLVSCGRNRDVNLRALVGDGTLPAAIVGSNETVVVDLGHATSGPTAGLELILAPDNRLTVRRYSMNGGIAPSPGPEVKFGRGEQIELSHDQANRFRMRVSLFRPPRLATDAPIIKPKDCPTILDAASRAVVVFQNGQRFGAFELLHGCENANAKKLEAELRNTVSLLPKTKTAAGFQW